MLFCADLVWNVRLQCPDYTAYITGDEKLKMWLAHQELISKMVSVCANLYKHEAHCTSWRTFPVTFDCWIEDSNACNQVAKKSAASHSFFVLSYTLCHKLDLRSVVYD